MKISALTIVKNEADRIEKSINSYKDVVDEIIIIDTGSTDNTKEICTNLGCKVIDYEWDNDFSKARNFAIEQAKYDCILFLDADEYFENKLDNNFRKSVEDILNKEYTGVKFLTYNLDVDYNKCINTCYGLKLFKNDGIKYRRSIHEVLDYGNGEIATLLGYNIVHTGYKISDDKEKLERNLKILKHNYDKHNYETMDLFYLTRENMMLGNYQEADVFCEKFFQQPDYLDVIAQSDIAYQIYYYQCYIFKELPDEYNYEMYKMMLMNLKHVLPDVPQTYYEIAMYEIDNNYRQALQDFKKAIKLNIDFSSSSQLANNFSIIEPYIYYNMARVEYILGEENEALSHVMVACMLDRRNSNFLGLFLKIVRNKNIIKIIETINKIYQPHSTSDYEFLVNSLVNTKLYGVFVEYAIKYNIEHNGGNNTVYIAMMLNTQVELCINTLLSIYKNKGDDYNLYLVTLAIMYANDIGYYHKYHNELPKKYDNILKFYYGLLSKLEDDDYDIYIDVYARLIHMTSKLRYSQEIDFERITPVQANKIFDALEDINNYQGEYELLHRYLCHDNLKDIRGDMMHRLLFALFITRQYELFLKYYYHYIKYEYIDTESCLNMLEIAKERAN